LGDSLPGGGRRKRYLKSIAKLRKVREQLVRLRLRQFGRWTQGFPLEKKNSNVTGDRKESVPNTVVVELYEQRRTAQNFTEAKGEWDLHHKNRRTLQSPFSHRIGVTTKKLRWMREGRCPKSHGGRHSPWKIRRTVRKKNVSYLKTACHAKLRTRKALHRWENQSTKCGEQCLSNACGCLTSF